MKFDLFGSRGKLVPTSEEWAAAVAAANLAPVVKAHSYRGIQFSSFSMPVVLGCDDGEDYVVKAVTQPQLGRAICNDQIMGHVAKAMNAAVPEVRLVEIPQTLIDGEPALASFPAGLAHGSRYMNNVSKSRQGFHNVNLPDNRPRFSLLAIMYGLAHVDGDHQFFYEDGTGLVWSFDHGHFFPGGPDWTPATLVGCPAVAPDSAIVSHCNLLSTEIATVIPSLSAVTIGAVAMAVSSPDSSWNLPDDDRIAVAEHLLSRRQTLLP